MIRSSGHPKLFDPCGYRRRPRDGNHPRNFNCPKDGVSGLVTVLGLVSGLAF